MSSDEHRHAGHPPGCGAVSGVKRRQEFKGIASGVTVVDDFAHHPTAVRETLSAVKGHFGPGKLVAVFEPRSATSRRAVFQADWPGALANADAVVLAPLHAPAKIPESERLDLDLVAAQLREMDIPTRLTTSHADIADHLVDQVVPGDTVMFMSSGSMAQVEDMLLHRLGDPVRPARFEDKSAIGSLLDKAGLARPQLDKFWPDYLVIPEVTQDDNDQDGSSAAPTGHLVGCVALERTGDIALLRSLAVAPSRRGEGLGYLLVETAAAKVKAEGARDLYLVTTGAQSFFAAKLGFKEVPRNALDPAIEQTSEFQMARSKEATWMLRPIG